MTEHAFGIDLLDIDRLAPNPANSNEGDIGAISIAIAVDGWHGTCIAQDRGTDVPMLIAGEHRWRALRALQQHGIDLPGVGHRSYEQLLADPNVLLPPLGKVPGQILDVNDTQAVRKMLADNRASALSTTDDQHLAMVLSALAAEDALLGTLFDGDDLDILLADIAADDAMTRSNATDYAPPKPKKPITTIGDLIVLGDHRLLCGDSRHEAAYELLLDDAQVDMVWTDPPYGVQVASRIGTKGVSSSAALAMGGETIENDDLNPAALAGLLTDAFTGAVGVCRPGAVWFVAAPAGPLFGVFGNVLAGFGIWRQTLVWLKDSLVLSRADYHYRHEAPFMGWVPGAGHHRPSTRDQDSVWEFPRPKRSEEHPTMKPVGLVVRAITTHTDAGALVLDPFAGSGTTLVACEQEGRRARCIELDPGYCDVIVDRWEAMTGEQAERLESISKEPH